VCFFFFLLPFWIIAIYFWILDSFKDRRASSIYPNQTTIFPFQINFSMPLIPQDLSYHDFADQTTRYGIPHFLEVITNIPFFLVGLYGLTVAKRQDYRIFFIGFLLTAFGSAYYHWNPNNSTLVWDRLPMSISLMGLFCVFCADYGVKWVKLYPALLFGVGSVLYWAKYDELVPYGVTQFGSLLYNFYLLLMKRSPYDTRLFLFLAFASYGLAKVTETADKEIYALLNNQVSGHNLKHLLAALGGVFVIVHLKGPGKHAKSS
jgi:hypothetical protein